MKLQKTHKLGLVLSIITVAYNILEGVASVVAGALSGSIALVGFGLDSFIESLSGSVMIWRLRKHGKVSEEEEEATEARAAMLIGITFFILAAYVLFESTKAFLTPKTITPSLFGIVIAILSLIFMPALAYLKNKTGKAIGSRSLVADSKQTLICILMSIALLVSLGANYLFSIAWLDAAAGLFFVIILVKEGYVAIKYKDLC